MANSLHVSYDVIQNLLLLVVPASENVEHNFCLCRQLINFYRHAI